MNGRGVFLSMKIGRLIATLDPLRCRIFAVRVLRYIENAEINRDRWFKPRPTGIGHVGLLSHPAGKDYGWLAPFLDHNMVL